MSVNERINNLCIRDKAVLVLPEDGSEPPKLTIRGNATFTCSCGTTFEKKVMYILRSGVYCRECILQRTREKVKQTCMERYGTPHHTQCQAVIAKRVLMNPEEAKEKRIQTNLSRYGVPYPYQCKEILEKYHNTLLEKYGSTTIFDVPEVKEKKNRTLALKRIERFNHSIERFKTSVAWMQQEIDRLTALYNLNQSTTVS